MAFFALEAILSGLLIALVASLPLVSILGMLWLWHETRDPVRMQAHVGATFWYGLPSLPMFLAIPALIRGGLPFYAALGLGCALTVALCAVVIWIAPRLGISRPGRLCGNRRLA